MPSDPRRTLSNGSAFLLAMLVTVLLLLLVAFARGPEHRRGDDVGAGSVAALQLSAG